MMAQAQALMEMMSQGGAAGAAIQQMMSMAGGAKGGGGKGGGGGGFGKGKGKGGGSAPMMEGDWICGSCGDHQFARNLACRKCGAPREEGQEPESAVIPVPARLKQAMETGSSNAPVEQGDWFCSSCGDHQFARNVACRKCGAPRPDDAGDPPEGFGGGGAQQEMPGDWNCPACGDHQFARNSVCRKCGSPKGGAGAGGGLMAALMAAMGGGGFGGKGAFGGKAMGGKGTMVEGDWICPSCGDHQFARNMACRKCGAEKDEGAVLQQPTNSRLKPGDWICPGCGDHQFQRNMQCRKCGMDKPASAERSAPY